LIAILALAIIVIEINKCKTLARTNMKLNTKNRFISFIMMMLVTILMTACGDSEDDVGTVKTSGSQEDLVSISVAINGSQAVPSLQTKPTATGSITVDKNSGNISGSVDVSNLKDNNNVTAMHIHMGKPGETGGPIITFQMEGNDNNRWMVPENSMLNATDLSMLLQGDTYINVHTTEVGSGQIRGQILPSDKELTVSDLSGKEQIPTEISSNLTATGYTTFNSSTNRIDVRVNISDTSAVTAIHIHNASFGNNGQIVLPLDADTSGNTSYSASMDLSSELVDAYQRGNLYFNLHTTNNPTGELRGQILPSDVFVSKTTLSGEQQIPTVIASDGSANAYITVDKNNNTLSGIVRYFNLTDVTAAHIHNAYAGENGAVAFPFELMGNDTLELNGTLNADALAKLLRGEFYINLHTSTNMAGELRGQIIPENILLVRSLLDSDQVTQEVSSSSSGIAYTTVNETSGDLISNLNLFDIENVSAIHIHDGVSGMTGDIVVPLQSVNENSWKATSTLDAIALEKFKTAGLYYNVHTTTYPKGEIRGQINP